MSKYTARGGDWKKVRLRILSRDNYTCAYCQGEATTVDHIIPVSKGGGNGDSNLVAACQRCNRAKTNKSLMRNQFINQKYIKTQR